MPRTKPYWLPYVIDIVDLMSSLHYVYFFLFYYDEIYNSHIYRVDNPACLTVIVRSNISTVKDMLDTNTNTRRNKENTFLFVFIQHDKTNIPLFMLFIIYFIFVLF